MTICNTGQKHNEKKKKKDEEFHATLKNTAINIAERHTMDNPSRKRMQIDATSAAIGIAEKQGMKRSEG